MSPRQPLLLFLRQDGKRVLAVLQKSKPAKKPARASGQRTGAERIKVLVVVRKHVLLDWNIEARRIVTGYREIKLDIRKPPRSQKAPVSANGVDVVAIALGLASPLCVPVRQRARQDRDVRHAAVYVRRPGEVLPLHPVLGPHIQIPAGGKELKGLSQRRHLQHFRVSLFSDGDPFQNSVQNY